jgi:hypothetical protein
MSLAIFNWTRFFHSWLRRTDVSEFYDARHIAADKTGIHSGFQSDLAKFGVERWFQLSSARTLAIDFFCFTFRLVL